MKAFIYIAGKKDIEPIKSINRAMDNGIKNTYTINNIKYSCYIAFQNGNICIMFSDHGLIAEKYNLVCIKHIQIDSKKCHYL